VKAAIDGGRKVSSFCVNCHGDDGVSKIPEVPIDTAQ
jgi:cytochrome c553